MVRRAVTVALATGLFSVAALPSACKQPSECGFLQCDPVHAVLTAHVKVPLASFPGTRTTVCWNDVCSLLVGGADGGAAQAPALDPQGLLLGEVSVSAEGNDAAQLRVSLRFFTRGSDGEEVYMRQANGDRYRVTVVDSLGKTAFDLQKTAVYDEYYPNGSNCDPDPCRRISLDLAAP